MAGVSTQLLFDHPACVMTHLSAHVQEQLVDVLAPLGIHPRQFGLLNLLDDDMLSPRCSSGWTAVCRPWFGRHHEEAKRPRDLAVGSSQWRDPLLRS